jgi:hypothetical protein
MERNGEASRQTGTIDAASFAKDSRAKTLILAHLGARIAAPGSIEKAISDISRIFSGKIIVSQEHNEHGCFWITKTKREIYDYWYPQRDKR